MNLTRYRREEKIFHLLRWAAEWNGDLKGASAWSYSLKLGGSHALLNGWMKNHKIMSTLTRQEKEMVDRAREASRSRSRQSLQL